MSLSKGWLGSSGTPLSAIGEFGLIERLRRLTLDLGQTSSRPGSDQSLGIGDDAAVIHPSPGFEALLSCDVQVEGRHFRRDWITPRELGVRVATVNLSDIAAMGGVPRAALLSVALSPDIAVEDLDEIYHGMLDRLGSFDADLVGGNVSSLPTGLVLDMTIFGEVEADRLLRRDRCEIGDLVWVTGNPGSSAAGRILLERFGPDRIDSIYESLVHAYLAPLPRVKEARSLAVQGLATSMIDTSDGLFADLHHLVEGPGLGMQIEETALPLSQPLQHAAQVLGLPPDRFLLGASDDYELLFTTPPDAERRVAGLQDEFGLPVSRIGIVTEEPKGRVLLIDREGRVSVADPQGWDHLR